MKRVLLFLGVVWLVSTAVASVSGDFISNLSDHERQAAGLDRLSEQQRAALNALADRWVERRADAVIRAERERAVAETKATLAAAKPAARANADPLRTRLVGEFRGWETGTVFALENGEAWAVDGLVVARSFSPRRAPAVELREDDAGVWRLQLLSENVAVRVKRVK